MSFNFDEVIDRVGTHSSKWDTMEAKYGVSPETGIAMWVADMDFRAPQVVQDALARALEHGVHGYFGDDSEYRAALISWMKRRHHWDVQPDWIVNATGLGNALSLCIRSFSEPGEGIIVFSPVYHAFARIINATDRRILESELVQRDGRYYMDLDTLAASLTGNEKMIIFCSPHNPGGRIWTADELRDLAAFCERNDIIICSDEIHHDLILPGHKHHLMAKVAPQIADRLITLVATSKTFNIAGIETGSMLISDRALRSRIMPVYKAASISPNRFGMTMAEAAYRGGDEWLDTLMLYLDRNRRRLNDAITAIPGMSVMDLEATYLGWVDFSSTGMTADEVLARCHCKGLVPYVGATFGAGGEHYLRLNIACRHAMLDDAMDRLADAFSDLQ